MNQEYSESFQDIETRLVQTLAPVAPAPAFRARLCESLLTAARHQVLLEKPSELRWLWVIGAAVLGSVAGVLALVLRARVNHKPSPQVAAPSH